MSAGTAETIGTGGDFGIGLGVAAAILTNGFGERDQAILHQLSLSRQLASDCRETSGVRVAALREFAREYEITRFGSGSPDGRSDAIMPGYFARASQCLRDLSCITN